MVCDTWVLLIIILILACWILYMKNSCNCSCSKSLLCDCTCKCGCACGCDIVCPCCNMEECKCSSCCSCRCTGNCAEHCKCSHELGYELTSKGIMILKKNAHNKISLECDCDIIDHSHMCNCKSVEDFLGHYRSNKHSVHHEGFEAPDFLPQKPDEEAIDTTTFGMHIVDNIIGRLPGVEGRGVKKLKVRAKLDGKVYIVRDFPDYQQAAETLAKLNGDALKLIDYIKKKYPSVEYTTELIKHYDGQLSEETPKNLENLTSYTLDKETIVSCIRTKKGEHKIHDYNLLLYVFIHEMGHMANNRSYGHDEHFEDAFRWLLQRADELGILKRIDFEKNPQNFCGLPITVNLNY